MQKNYLKFPVEFVDDPFGESAYLADFVGTHKMLIIADYNVVQRTEGLGTRIGAYVQAHKIALADAPLVFQGCERMKTDNCQSALRVVRAIYDARLEVGDVVLALGGGSLLDIVGWAVAQIRIGVRFVRVPTTPAAMLGLAYDDRASLNLPMVKGALSLESRPDAVIVSLPFARTVLDGVWRAGIGEVVRLVVDKDVKSLAKIYALIGDYIKRDDAALSELVKLAVALRMKKGATDLALAAAAELEPKSGWKLPHGYAVDIGILIDILAAVKAGTCKQAVFDQCFEILRKCGAVEAMHHSKHILPHELADF